MAVSDYSLHRVKPETGYLFSPLLHRESSGCPAVYADLPHWYAERIRTATSFFAFLLIDTMEQPLKHSTMAVTVLGVRPRSIS